MDGTCLSIHGSHSTRSYLSQLATLPDKPVSARNRTFPRSRPDSFFSGVATAVWATPDFFVPDSSYRGRTLISYGRASSCVTISSRALAGRSGLTVVHADSGPVTGRHLRCQPMSRCPPPTPVTLQVARSTFILGVRLSPVVDGLVCETVVTTAVGALVAGAEVPASFDALTVTRSACPTSASTTA